MNISVIRKDFPILERKANNGKDIVYLDSTATSQKPQQVIEAMNIYYQQSNANIHRGVHTLAEEATAMYEGAREKIAKFINAKSSREVIYTRNTTESINLVAYSWARTNLKAGDLVVLTEMEHHSNLVPWHMLQAEKNIEIDFISVTDDGLLDLDSYKTLLDRSPKLVSFTHMSNVLGTINPVREMIEMAHQVGAIVLIDGAQSAPHLKVDVQKLDADFYAFSAHKMCGPTGIGILYGKSALLESMPPFLGGGDMIKEVKLRSFRANTLPHKFEAGTPAIAEAVGFGAAVDYLSSIGMDNIAKHEHEITEYALERLEEIQGVKLFGPSVDKKGGVAAFTLDGIHPHDVAQILDQDGIAVRAGHHCAQPLHEKFGIPATSRASFYLYSTKEEVDLLVKGLYKVKEMFK
ncbi:MAG: cysteine desulfurase/selenocysteine lyase [Chloroflexi bacterium OLB14]|nr:MAG: cysteine desulfurase/selenocysteine lyase [Chloroflexi bacterium OLB14]